MPAESARTPDESLFTGPVLQWLRDRGCRSVHALDSGDDDTPAWVTLPVGRHAAPVSGWRVGWPGEDGRTRHVLLEFGEPAQLPDAPRRELADYLRFAGRCADGAGGAAHLIDRDETAQRLHDLRNGLNSLLMNAAVMTTKLPPAERDSRFARQVQDDGERCAALLQELADAIRPPESPRRG